MYRIPMRYKILFLFITIGAVFQLAAQGRVKLTGRVYDSDNQPIELATVRVAGTYLEYSDGDDDRFERGVSAFHSGRRFHRGDLFLFGVSGGAPPVAQSHERCFLVGASE